MTSCPLCRRRVVHVADDGCTLWWDEQEDEDDRLERLADERSDAAGDAWRDEQ